MSGCHPVARGDGANHDLCPTSAILNQHPEVFLGGNAVTLSYKEMTCSDLTGYLVAGAVFREECLCGR